MQSSRKKPVISVIMGVYNCPDRQTAERSVNSVLNQSFRDIEFIICDDGSDNGTFDWLKRLAKSDNRIKLIRRHKNKGLASALNRCISLSRGDFIARQDIDDISEINRFEKQLEFLKKHNDIAFVGSDCLLMGENGEVFGRRHMPERPKAADFLFNQPFIHGSVMFRRSALTAAGGYKTVGISRKYEDYELFMRLHSLGQIGANIPECLYSFSEKSLGRRVSPQMRLDEFFVRLRGFRALGLLPRSLPFLLKPLAMIFFPPRLTAKIRSFSESKVN